MEADLEDEARCWDESDLGDIGHMRRGWSGDVHGEQEDVGDVLGVEGGDRLARVEGKHGRRVEEGAIYLKRWV